MVEDGCQRVNRYVTICNLQRKAGVFAEGNVKSYGKNLSLKAGDRSQAMMMFKFKPQLGGDIKNITPHKYFNTVKGIVFSSDLLVQSFWNLRLEKNRGEMKVGRYLPLIIKNNILKVP